jgi:hypothetical protein
VVSTPGIFLEFLGNARELSRRCFRALPPRAVGGAAPGPAIPSPALPRRHRQGGGRQQPSLRSRAMVIMCVCDRRASEAQCWSEAIIIIVRPDWPPLKPIPNTTAICRVMARLVGRRGGQLPRPSGRGSPGRAGPGSPNLRCRAGWSTAGRPGWWALPPVAQAWRGSRRTGRRPRAGAVRRSLPDPLLAVLEALRLRPAVLFVQNHRLVERPVNLLLGQFPGLWRGSGRRWRRHR